MEHQILFSVPLSEIEQFHKKWMRDVITESEKFFPSTPSQPDELLTVKELAERTGCSKPKVYAMVQRGQLTARRFGGEMRFVWSEVIQELPKIQRNAKA